MKRCFELEKSGQLREGVSAAGCMQRVCQEDGRRFYRANRFEEALGSLTQVEGLLRGSPSLALDKGEVFYALYRFDEALAKFDEVLDTFPQSVRAAAQRAHTLIRLGRLPEARSQFEKMLGFENSKAEFKGKGLRSNSYVTGNLAVLKLMEGDVAGGKREFQHALELDPRNPLAHTYLDRMVPELEAKQVGPDGVAMIQVVFEELSFGRGNDAVKLIGEMLKRWPNFRLGYVVAADTQRRYGNFYACEDTLTAALSRFPKDVKIQVERIRCTLMRKGVRSTEALPDVADLKRLAITDPDDALIQEILMLLEQ